MLKKPSAIAATLRFSINGEGVVLLFIMNVLKGEKNIDEKKLRLFFSVW